MRISDLEAELIPPLRIYRSSSLNDLSGSGDSADELVGAEAKQGHSPKHRRHRHVSVSVCSSNREVHAGEIKKGLLNFKRTYRLLYSVYNSSELK